MIGWAPLRQVKKCFRPIPIFLTTKINRTSKDFQKVLDIKTRGTKATAKPEVTTTTKNNDHNTTREFAIR